MKKKLTFFNNSQTVTRFIATPLVMIVLSTINRKTFLPSQESENGAYHKKIKAVSQVAYETAFK